MLLHELKDFKTKLEYHHQLNQDLWDGDSLRKEVLKKIRENVDAFLEELDIPASKVKDVVFTGSNANYNWTALSDVDVHIILKDSENADEAGPWWLWNESHDISIYGYTVEMYLENESTNNSGNAGVYSIKDNKWIQEPEFENIRFDYEAIKKKTRVWMNKIDKAIKSAKSATDLEALNDKLKEVRQKGIARGGEFNMENLVFKALRNNGYVQNLRDRIKKLKDEALSLS